MNRMCLALGWRTNGCTCITRSCRESDVALLLLSGCVTPHRMTRLGGGQRSGRGLLTSIVAPIWDRRRLPEGRCAMRRVEVQPRASKELAGSVKGWLLVCGRSDHYVVWKVGVA